MVDIFLQKLIVLVLRSQIVPHVVVEDDVVLHIIAAQRRPFRVLDIPFAPVFIRQVAVAADDVSDLLHAFDFSVRETLCEIEGLVDVAATASCPTVLAGECGYVAPGVHNQGLPLQRTSDVQVHKIVHKRRISLQPQLVKWVVEVRLGWHRRSHFAQQNASIKD